MRVADVLVIGAGPIGLETAAKLQAEGLSVLTIDAGAIGSTIEQTFPPDTRFFTSPERLVLDGFDIPSTSQEKVTGEAYIAYLRSFVTTRGLKVDTFQTATDIKRTENGFVVTTVDRLEQPGRYACEHLILATGGTHAPRRLGVPGENLPHVSHYLAHPNHYFGRRVLIVGGRNSAAESALRLYRLGAEVALSYRQPTLYPRIKFWIRPEVEALIAEGTIAAHMPTVVEEIRPEFVVLRNTDSGETTSIEVDDVLIQAGFTQDPTIFRLAGISTQLPDGAPQINPDTMQSQQSGIYIVGTAVAGTQSRFNVFIENCHQHADRVAAALTGRAAPPPQPTRALPEA